MNPAYTNPTDPGRRIFPPSMRTSSHRERVRAGAFTLMEMLVTIAVVLVLVGLVSPALGSARRTAKYAACGNNLRQIAIACIAYADDNRDALPPMTWEESGMRIEGQWPWDVPRAACDALASYGADRRVLSCPTLPLHRVDEAWNYRTNYRVIGYVIATRGAPLIEERHLHELARGVRLESATSPPTNRGRTNVVPDDSVREVALMPLSVDIVVSAEKSADQRSGVRFRGIPGGYSHSGRQVVHGTAHLPDSGTPRSANAVYLDGHLERTLLGKMEMRSKAFPYFWW